MHGGILPAIYSDISSAILAFYSISSDSLSGILFWHLFSDILYLASILTFYLASILAFYCHSMWHPGMASTSGAGGADTRRGRRSGDPHLC